MMSANLYVYSVRKPEERNQKDVSVQVVSSFSQEFLDTFADFIFLHEVDIVDWLATIGKTGRNVRQFLEEYELLQPSRNGVNYFAPKGCINPVRDRSLIKFEPKDLVLTTANEKCIAVYTEAVVKLKLTDNFHEVFSPFEPIFNENQLHQLEDMCAGADALQEFMELVVLPWENGKFFSVIEF
jgi:hypothetical protein